MKSVEGSGLCHRRRQRYRAGIAKVFAASGMKVVIADMRQDALDEAMAYSGKDSGLPTPSSLTSRIVSIRAGGRRSRIGVRQDPRAHQQRRRGHRRVDAVGHLQGLDYGLGVNIGGVVNGLVIVLPRILKHGEGGHVVSTSSTAGYALSVAAASTRRQVRRRRHDGALATDLQGTGVGHLSSSPARSRPILGFPRR